MSEPPVETDPAASKPRSRAANLIEIAAVFIRLGFTAFGGPMAHLALMENELVTKRKWCGRQRFLDMATTVNFIPGPNSTELAIHMGFIRGGFPGLVLAGACFITPAVLIILPIAFLYVRYGSLPQVTPVLHTVAAAIVAIVASACLRLAKDAFKGPFPMAIGVITLALLVLGAMDARPVKQLFQAIQPEIFLLALAAILGIVWKAKTQGQRLTSIAILPLGQTSLPSLEGVFDSRWIEMIWFFVKVGATLFGSGYVLVSFLQTGLVEQYHWLSMRELNDAIAVGQFTPGPLLTTATFAGYVLGFSTFGYGDAGGVVGAAVATMAIFAPSFIFVAVLAPVLERLRQSVIARGALDAMNAAVVVMIGFTIWRLAGEAFSTASADKVGIVSVDWLNVAIAAAGLVLMLWKNVNATWLVAGAIAIGAIRIATIGR